MRIGISINGQGRGHLTRMTALAQILEREHELVFWCPDKYHPFLKAHFPESFIFSIPYYKLVIEENRIDLLKTSLDNFEHILSSGAYTSDLYDQIRLMDIDSLISDFEPFVPKAARKAGIPIIQLNHPSVVLRSAAFSPDALLAKIISSLMMGEYDQRIISSFYQGDVGPIIRREIREAQPETGDFFLVYLHESMRPQVVEELEKRGLKHQVFPQPGEDFVAALASCRGVITNAGHQLLSETLHLKKPVLSLPFEKQYEQTLNAKMLEKSGRGIVGRLTSLEEYLDKYLSFTEHFDPSYRPSEAGVHFRLEDDSRRAIDLLQRHLEQRERVS